MKKKTSFAAFTIALCAFTLASCQKTSQTTPVSGQWRATQWITTSQNVLTPTSAPALAVSRVQIQCIIDNQCIIDSSVFNWTPITGYDEVIFNDNFTGTDEIHYANSHAWPADTIMYFNWSLSSDRQTLIISYSNGAQEIENIKFTAPGMIVNYTGPANKSYCKTYKRD
jgi:hypothetical protein